MRTITEVAKDLEKVTTDERQATIELRSLDEQRDTHREVIEKATAARRQLMDELSQAVQEAVNPKPVEDVGPSPELR